MGVGGALFWVCEGEWVRVGVGALFDNAHEKIFLT